HRNPCESLHVAGRGGTVKVLLLPQVEQREVFSVRGERRQGGPERAVHVEAQTRGRRDQVQQLAAHATPFTEVVDGGFALHGSAASAAGPHAIERSLCRGKNRGRSATASDEGQRTA